MKYILTFLSLLGWFFLIVLLTLMSQTGGVLLFIFLCVRPFLPKMKNKALNRVRNLVAFLLFYSAVNFILIPPIAKGFGKVPMPVFSKTLQAHRLAYAFLNRHYVTPRMRAEVIRAAEELNKTYPGTIVTYLDGSHPIGHPRLYPHIRHKSGKKLDICFFYKNKQTGESLGNPSFFGYGFFVPVLAGERDLPSECERRGAWQYSLTGKLVLPSTGQDLEIDARKNQDFLQILTNRKEVRRIFIEPHLKQRFGMQNNDKLRFHGCWAVRHDDHLHLEVQ